MQNWKKILVLVFASLAAVAAAAALLDVCDYAIFRLRAKGAAVYGSVTVSHYYAVTQKNGKTQFLFDPPQPQTCIHTLFSHQGYAPCWYLSRHPEQRTDL